MTRGNALNLIKYFISDRPQQIRLEGILSDTNNYNSSVPQSIVLCPVLLVYIYNTYTLIGC